MKKNGGAIFVIEENSWLLCQPRETAQSKVNAGVPIKVTHLN